MIQNMDRLKTFFFVFSTKKVADAATALHISQSAVSQSIQKLEGELGTALFTRLCRRMVPTPAGERLFALVEPFMQDLDIYLKYLEESKDHPFGELRIGAPPEFGKAYLPGLAAGFRKKYPDVTFHFTFGPPETIIPLVGEGSLDVALADVFLPDSGCSQNRTGYRFTPLVEETIILASSKQYHADHINEDTSFESISQQDFIDYKHNSRAIEYWFRHHYGKTRNRDETVLIVDDHEAVISAIKHGMGLGIVASHLVEASILAGDIIAIRPTPRNMVNQISLVCLQNKIQTISEKLFEEYLTDSITSSVI